MFTTFRQTKIASINTPQIFAYQNDEPLDFPVSTSRQSNTTTKPFSYLFQACEYLGITKESDYFGLKYESNKGEELWLNLRNPIDRQVSSHHGHTSPLRLALRVKFWVPPHLLLQETTRHQFYLHARLDLIEKRLLANDWDSVARLIALIAQAECGDYEPHHPPTNVYLQASTISSACDQADAKPTDLLQRIIGEHKKYRAMKRSTAEYWLLKEIADFETYGMELFQAKLLGLGVGPHGITLFEKSAEKQLISFTNIISASSHRRNFKLEYFAIDNKVTVLDVKLDSCHVATSVYRAITEKHAFYSCETVRRAVTTQFIRDLKGTIVSIFNEDSTWGKKYVFDIRRTCREVYDNARRALYQENVMAESVSDMEKCESDNEGDICKVS